MVLILGIAGVGGLWVFAPDIPRRFLGMMKDDTNTPSLENQVIGTWKAEEGHTITITSDTFTGKSGTSFPYAWQEGSIKMRKLGPLEIMSGNLVVDAGPVKMTSLTFVGPDGNSLVMKVGEKPHMYRRVGTDGASPSTSAPQSTASNPVSAPAKEVDLRKIIAVQKDETVTELQKESQADVLSGLITVTGKITSSMRSSVDKSQLQIFICPIDSDHTRSGGISTLRCQVSEFGKDVVNASVGDKIKITGHGKYEPGMMEFVIRSAKAELTDATGVP